MHFAEETIQRIADALIDSDEAEDVMIAGILYAVLGALSAGTLGRLHNVAAMFSESELRRLYARPSEEEG